jgi:hypothetical protein
LEENKMKLGQTLSALVLATAMTTGCGGGKSEPLPTPTAEEYVSSLSVVPVCWRDPRISVWGEGYLDDLDGDGHVDSVHKMAGILWAVPDLELKVDLLKRGFIINRNDATRTITPEIQEALDKAYQGGIKAGYALTREAYDQERAAREHKK